MLVTGCYWYHWWLRTKTKPTDIVEQQQQQQQQRQQQRLRQHQRQRWFSKQLLVAKNHLKTLIWFYRRRSRQYRPGMVACTFVCYPPPPSGISLSGRLYKHARRQTLSCTSRLVYEFLLSQGYNYWTVTARVYVLSCSRNDLHLFIRLRQR